MGSKDWVPRNYVQRLGAFTIGAVYVMGAVLCMVSTFWFRGELTAAFHSETAAVVIGFFLVCIALGGGAIVMALGIRLLKGAFRPSANRS
jgi:amino acid transporter